MEEWVEIFDLDSGETVLSKCSKWEDGLGTSSIDALLEPAVFCRARRPAILCAHGHGGIAVGN